jgi:hypothetical protein
LFPPGPEQSQLRRIARSLTFFEECLHSDEDFANKSTLLFGLPSSAGRTVSSESACRQHCSSFTRRIAGCFRFFL